MSVENLIGDLEAGNFDNAGSRLKDWWQNSVTPALRNLLGVVATDEGKILQGLVSVAAQDVITGGFTTASFVAAAKDVGSKLAAQEITMAQTTIFAALNAEVNVQATASGVALPTNVPAEGSATQGASSGNNTSAAG